MRYRELLFSLLFLVAGPLFLAMGCEDEPPMQRNPEPPTSPKVVAPAAAEPVRAVATKETAPTPQSDAAPGGDKRSQKDAPAKPKAATEAAANKAKAQAADTRKKSAALPEGPNAIDPLAPVPRPKTHGPTTGAALGGPPLTSLVQIVRPTAAVAAKTTLQITRPTPNEVLRHSNLKVQVRLTGFEPYKLESGKGQWLKVVVDNEAARDWYDADEQEFRLSGLSPGWHSVRVFAIDRNGECVKDAQAFDAVNFYVRTSKDAPVPLDFSKPMLTYNLPSGTYSGAAAHRIPLDFHLANTALSKGGHRVRVKIGKLPAFDLSAWTPALMEGLPNGTHAISLTLLGKDGKALVHPWNPIERQFTVAK